MKGRITVEIDFENGNRPVIQLLHSPDSDDVRDKLINNFLETMRQSHWCRFEFINGNHSFNRYYISAIPLQKVKEQAIEMHEQYEKNKEWLLAHEKELQTGKSQYID